MRKSVYMTDPKLNPQTLNIMPLDKCARVRNNHSVDEQS